MQQAAEVRAVLSVGTRARGGSEVGSDWDYVVLCDPAPPAAGLRWELLLRHTDEHAVNVFDDVSWEFGTTDDAVVGRDEVCLSYYARAAAEAKVEAIAAGRCRKVGFYYPTGFLAALADAVPLYDPDRWGAHLCGRVKTYPDDLRETILRDERWHTAYYLDRLESAITRGDDYYAHELLGLALNALIQRLFAVHRTYFRAPKRIEAQLDALPLRLDRGELVDTIDFVITRPNDGVSLSAKRSRLTELAALVDAEERDA